jgi:integrase
LNPDHASAEDCIDFLHHLFAGEEEQDGKAAKKGKSARTVDFAKSSLVAFFEEKKVRPNPAQEKDVKRYVISLQKYSKQNGLEDEKKAHPLSVHELSLLIDSFHELGSFTGAMYRFLYCACFLGCFRISEMLNLKWNDVGVRKDDKGEYVSIRLKWHKKASVESECQIYNLVDEKAIACLRVCGFFGDYIEVIKRNGSPNFNENSFVFPAINLKKNGKVMVNWYKQLDQTQIRLQLEQVVYSHGELPTGITLHSMRRGGSFYRVFESPERRFNFKELMAWCRWSDAKTCCEYLITRSISSAIDPRNLMRNKKFGNEDFVHNFENFEEIRRSIDDLKDIILNTTKPPSETKIVEKPRLPTMEQYVSQTIPTARSAKEAWEQWFTGDPEFQQAYSEYTYSYSKILREVRKRKRDDNL